MNDDNNIRFIARHYRCGRFAAEPAFRRIMPALHSRLLKARIAAACAILIAVGATAALLISRNTTPAEEIQTEVKTDTAPAAIVRVIDFESTPLPVVADKIKEVYDVTVTGLPENAADINLSLHYEGTAADLVATINEILSTEMTITE